MARIDERCGRKICSYRIRRPYGYSKTSSGRKYREAHRNPAADDHVGFDFELFAGALRLHALLALAESKSPSL